MKRGELKALIKECVVEVLQEGIGTSLSTQLKESRTATKSTKRKARLRKAAAAHRQVPVPGINTDISNDPVMSSIFSDTAATTLQQQVASERRGPPLVAEGADRAAHIAAEHEPDELFEGAENWAMLAFDI